MLVAKPGITVQYCEPDAPNPPGPTDVKAAIILKVEAAFNVDLCVFNLDGSTHFVNNASLQTTPTPGKWNWIPQT